MTLPHARAIGFLTLLLLAGELAVLLRPAAPSPLLARITVDQEQENAMLTPCSRFTAGFSQLPFTSGNFYQWPTLYHDKAAEVIEEHLESFSQSMDCDATTVAEGTPASPKLKELAGKLPTWKGKAVSQMEVGSVLLEFLRAYECALEERIAFKHTDSYEVLQQNASSAGTDDITWFELLTEVSEEERILLHERETARPILQRTLAVLTGLNRLFPLQNELQCIERTSLDVRNALALGAEASACLPRIWNAKDPLRDL
ncbi:MAG: hypothetical protein V1876_03495 [Candidatus Peregrinibacteria bacterium]